MFERAGARFRFWQALAFVTLLALACTVRARMITDVFDSAFKDATALWLPGRDWRELKAQCYQESLLRPTAVSHAGARGLCQFMPATWREVAPRLPAAFRGQPPEHPVASIHAAGAYMRRMRAVWTTPRPDIERQRLAQGSYNAGAGNLIAAQRVCKRVGGRQDPPCRDWLDISEALPAVTGHNNARETQTYVQRIERWLLLLRVVG